MIAYYNEIDPFAAAWLRELIKANHIAPGEVDTRSIKDVKGDDLKGFTQCHFFAGIGVWSYALRRAGWPDDRSIWTGSCPCQPFSAAGQGKGFEDDRHLWPDFHRLIAERNPHMVVGEQVASKIGLEWVDLVCVDMEKSGYAIGAVDTCAAGFGAPHIRQRLYWAAKRMEHAGLRPEHGSLPRPSIRQPENGSAPGSLEHATGDGWQQGWPQSSGRCIASGCGDGSMANAHDDGLQGRVRGGGRMRNGKLSTDRLDVAAQLTGWNTPAASDGNGGKKPHTDTTMSGQHPDGRKVNMGLASQAHIGFTKTEPCRLTAEGILLTGSSAKMENSGQLNPAHSRWLMGLPPAWDDCAVMAMQSMPSRRKRLSKV